ncbi:gephyrin-like molybdotransferase Glp [Shimia abyssi]|uniref:Molybdopterin molybdenumtransferase n=1 Tax=Shimia abyssi TaxID=1662395 RepID=A0A2P8FGT9_9RHOB|nr:gephyrin-like molybdotransferase Glp [Shimia abyssi]PSL20953.1 molybdopterin molybdotransferase [Shimia abyssi]
MSAFDTVVMLDWSAGNDRGAVPKRDAIWTCVARAGIADAPKYHRNRDVVAAYLAALIRDELAAGRRVFIGVDFPFGYPKGFARAVAGSDDPFALWDWLEARIEDSPKANNRFDLAGEINQRFGGRGPFWGNGLKRNIQGLPRRKDLYVNPFSDRRVVEEQAKGAFTCWQLSGAGSVGGQVLMGVPVLTRLRRQFLGHIAVWPFETLDKPVALVEVWPGLINPVVKEAEAQGEVRDAAQVRLMARALSRLKAERLQAMLDVDGSEEGWILGLGFEDELMAAAKTTLTPPPLKDDCFALPPGAHWTPVDEALESIRSRLYTVVPSEELTLGAALDRVIAADVVSRRSNPPLPNTAVDGYGLRHADIVDGAQEMPLVQGRSAAGEPFEGTLPEGHAVRVLTGAALPDGVDTVILQEDVTTDGEAIAFRGPLRFGANTRKAGEDVLAGEVTLAEGRCVTPADLALAAAVGLEKLPVYKRLKVAVVSTGDELAEAGTEARADQIYDANRPMLLAAIKRFGFEPVDMGRAPDDRAALREFLDRAAENADLILTSGGASAGDEDHLSALLNESGAMALWRIAIKPGRPLALGIWGGKPVFGLPGNPVAALVCTLIFARPAMGLLAGEGWQMPQALTVPAGFSKRKKPGRREYLRARLREGQVEVFASEGSGRISGLSWAEGLVELPDEAMDITPGTPVTYYPYTAFGL